MKVGDYVRTKSDGIGKIIKIESFMNDTHIFLDSEKGDITFQTKNRVCKVCNEESIIKSSPNIIDLIEVGDYVNGYPVAKIYKSTNKDIGRVIEYETDNVVGYEYEAEDLWESHIKSISIVTKEQFEAMEYKL